MPERCERTTVSSLGRSVRYPDPQALLLQRRNQYLDPRVSDRPAVSPRLHPQALLVVSGPASAGEAALVRVGAEPRRLAGQLPPLGGSPGASRIAGGGKRKQGDTATQAPSSLRQPGS